MPSNSKQRIRLDVLLVKKGLVESREKAKAMVMAGLVNVDGYMFHKPGHLIPVSSIVSLKTSQLNYVSRGGVKLEAALDHFAIDVKGQTILDIGASTGGFTDCLLQRGVEKVIAVDVGYGQFHWKLRQDPRVRLLEKRNIRYLKPDDLNERINAAVIDVSFISLKLVIPPVSQLLLENAYIIALIKPQFEVGRYQVEKGGVVRDPTLHEEVITKLCLFFHSLGWTVTGHTSSPILGPKGNREFLVHMKR